jgi:hypothetical protein
MVSKLLDTLVVTMDDLQIQARSSSTVILQSSEEGTIRFDERRDSTLAEHSTPAKLEGEGARQVGDMKNSSRRQEQAGVQEKHAKIWTSGTRSS